MIAENQKIELFDEFYNWLVADGLKAKKSERLHRKKIFASFIANDEMTLDNFYDFLAYKKEFDKKALLRRIKNFESQEILYLHSCRYITHVEIDENIKEFKLKTSCFETGKEINHIINCKFSQLEKIEKLIKKEGQL